MKIQKVNLKDNKNQWNKSLVFGKSNNLTNATRQQRKESRHKPPIPRIKQGLSLDILNVKRIRKYYEQHQSSYIDIKQAHENVSNIISH